MSQGLDSFPRALKSHCCILLGYNYDTMSERKGQSPRMAGPSRPDLRGSSKSSRAKYEWTRQLRVTFLAPARNLGAPCTQLEARTNH
jgi:hypothetical protein